MSGISIIKSDDLENTIKNDCDTYLRCEINIRQGNYSADLDSNLKSLKFENMFLVSFKKFLQG
jgi:hypothetical protein